MNLGMSVWDWIVVMGYFVGMVIIGIYCNTTIKEYSDHILAGRNLTTLYLAPGLLTTQIGAGSIIGFVGLSYSIGYSGGWWIISNIFTFIILGLIGAGPLRSAIGSATLPEWFANRYDERARMFTAITIAIAEIAFTVGQVVGGGLLFSVIMGWDVKIGIAIFSIVVAAYTVSGGLLAVCMTDLVQMFFMFVGILGLVIVGMKNVGGMASLKSSVPPSFFTLVAPGQVPTVIANILYAIPAIFCSFDVIQKIMGAKSPEVAKKSSYWAALLTVFFAVAIPLIGILGYVILGPNVANPESITPQLIAKILPSGLKGLAMAAVLATLMTSSDACLLAASTVITNDILKYIIKFDSLDTKVKLKYSMNITLAVGVISWLIATFFQQALSSMEIAWTALSCGAFIPLMFGILWKKTDSVAAFYSMIGGAVTGLLWLFLKNPYGLKPVIPAYIVGTVIIVVMTLTRSSKSPKIVL